VVWHVVSRHAEQRTGAMPTTGTVRNVRHQEMPFLQNRPNTSHPAPSYKNSESLTFSVTTLYFCHRCVSPSHDLLCTPSAEMRSSPSTIRLTTRAAPPLTGFSGPQQLYSALFLGFFSPPPKKNSLLACYLRRNSSFSHGSY